MNVLVRKHLVSVLAFALLGLMAAGSGSSDKKPEGTSPANDPPPAKPTPTVAVSGTASAAKPSADPAVEFVAQLNKYKEKYTEAPNDIKKSAVFNEAQDYAKGFFKKQGNKVTDWKGTLADMSTPKGGNELWLRVKVGDAGFFGFAVSFQQGFGLVEKGIPKSSPVYTAAGEMKDDQCVIFSGAVSAKEKSLSESGAMTSPEFNIVFSSLRACE